MQYTSGPQRIPLPFAENGGKNAIPEGSQIGVTPGAASLNDGFPPLTRQPLDAGGVPPFGLDMNGILWLISQLSRWQSAGGGIMYDSAFASDANVGGYPKGAVLLRADGAGFWLNTADNNATNPDTGGANWVPAFNYGVKTVTASNTNITLSVSDASKPIIVVSGTLTASVQVIVPAYAQQWIVVNNTTGAYTVTFKPSGGAGVLVGQGLARLVVCDGTNCIGVNAQEATSAQVAAKTAHDVYLSPANIDDLAKAIYGVTAVAVSNTNVTLSVSDAAKPIIVVSGTLTASVQVIVPAYAQQWVIVNNTTGAYTVTFKPSGGAGVLVGQGLARLVICDGTNCIGVNAQEATSSQVAAKTAHDVYLSPANIDDLAKAVGDKLMPVGTIYGNASSATNPATLLGFGTWVAIAGRFVVGKDGSTEFGTLGGTGGAKDVTLGTTNLPPHKHVVSLIDGNGGFPEWADPVIESSGQKSDASPYDSVYNARAAGRTSSVGEGTAFSILNPYFVAALWYRTA